MTTYEAVIENGQVRLPYDIHLPEMAKVYVVVPDVTGAPTARIVSPRLVNPEQAEYFAKEVTETEEESDAELR